MTPWTLEAGRDVDTYSSGEDVVLDVRLNDVAARTRGVGSDARLLVHLNPHPRPSFVYVPGGVGVVLTAQLVSRFGFSVEAAAALVGLLNRVR